ncbi:MAG: hypothetical protein HQL20_02535 [Candidatus Omnitrophica bacterium]|nr:hypothetical protein [Candidatus Omnitrophota bacterium]
MVNDLKSRVDAFFVLGWAVGLGCILDLAANMGDPFEILWFCSAASLLLSIGLFRRNSIIISMVFLMAVPAQFFWIVDFILQCFGAGWGRTALLLNAGPFVYWTSLLLHLLLIPASFFGVWRLGFDARAFWPSLGFGWGLLLLSFFFTAPQSNHNCVFYPCDGINPGGGYFFYMIRALLSWSAIFILYFSIMWFIFRNRTVADRKRINNDG